MHRITIERRGPRRSPPPEAPALAKPDAPAGGTGVPARPGTVHLPRRELLTVSLPTRAAEPREAADPSAAPAETSPDRPLRDKAAEEAEIRERARQAARETLRPLLTRPKAPAAEPPRADAKPAPAAPEAVRADARPRPAAPARPAPSPQTPAAPASAEKRPARRAGASAPWLGLGR